MKVITRIKLLTERDWKRVYDYINNEQWPRGTEAVKVQWDDFANCYLVLTAVDKKHKPITNECHYLVVY